jgi:hypothetical protein
MNKIALHRFDGFRRTGCQELLLVRGPRLLREIHHSDPQSSMRSMSVIQRKIVPPITTMTDPGTWMTMSAVGRIFRCLPETDTPARL